MYKMSNPVFWKNKKNIINLSSAEFAWRVVKVKGYCICLFVGHFVSSPREREKRDRQDSRRDEREEQGRKRTRNESEETEEIKTFPFYPYLL